MIFKTYLNRVVKNIDSLLKRQTVKFLNFHWLTPMANLEYASSHLSSETAFSNPRVVPLLLWNLIKPVEAETLLSIYCLSVRAGWLSHRPGTDSRLLTDSLYASSCVHDVQVQLFSQTRLDLFFTCSVDTSLPPSSAILLSHSRLFPFVIQLPRTRAVAAGRMKVTRSPRSLQVLCSSGTPDSRAHPGETCWASRVTSRTCWNTDLVAPSLEFLFLLLLVRDHPLRNTFRCSFSLLLDIFSEPHLIREAYSGVMSL